MLNYAFPTFTEFPLADLDNETKAKQKPHGNKIITENNIRRKQPFRGREGMQLSKTIESIEDHFNSFLQSLPYRLQLLDSNANNIAL